MHQYHKSGLTLITLRPEQNFSLNFVSGDPVDHKSSLILGTTWNLIGDKPLPRLCFYQSRSAWSVDQGPNKNHSPSYNFAPTVTQFCVMWEGLSILHDTKFGNCRCTIVDSRAFPSWSLIHGLCWSGLIKAEPGNDDPVYWNIYTSRGPPLLIWINFNPNMDK